MKENISGAAQPLVEEKNHCGELKIEARDDEGFGDGESSPSSSFTEASSSSVTSASSCTISTSVAADIQPPAYVDADLDNHSTTVITTNTVNYEDDGCYYGPDDTRLDLRYKNANTYDGNNNNNNTAKHDNSNLERCCAHIDSLFQRYNGEESGDIGLSTTMSCSCVIDVSTPATLERDFYAWLNQHKMETDDVSTACPYRPYPSGSYSSVAIDSNSSFYYPSFNSPSDSALHADDFLNYGIYGNGDGYASLNCVPDGGHCASSNSTSSVSPGSAGGRHEFPNVAQYMTPVIAANSQTPLYSTSAPIAGNPEGNTVVKKLPPVRGKSKAERRLQRGTNLYGRPYCPGRPLSMEERAQIINLFHGGMKVNAISKRLCISHGCVSKIITRFRETGLLIPSSHSECRRRKRLLTAAQQQEHHHQQQLILQQQQLQHQQLLRQQRQFLYQQQQKEQTTIVQEKEQPHQQQQRIIQSESC